MNSIPKLILLPFGKRQIPGLIAVESLLDLLSSAALLVDGQTGRIVLANSNATILTAFTRAELNNLKLSVLFPNWDKSILKEPPEALEKRSTVSVITTIARRNRPVDDIYISPTRLSSDGRWVLIALEEVNEFNQRQSDLHRREQFLEMHQLIALSMQESDLGKALEMVLRAGCVLLGASYLAVYRANVEKYELKRCATWGTGDLFPENIHPNDLVILDQPSIWVSGKRPLTQLHRAARAAGLTYLASAPLGQPNARIGMLALASATTTPSDEFLGYLPILAGSITSIMESQALTQNLQTRLLNVEAQLAVKSAIEESVLDGIVLISPDLTVLELNPSAESILGYATPEVRNQPYQNILVTTENLSPYFAIASDDNSIHDLGNINVYRRDGRVFLAHIRILSILREGKLVCFVVLIQDLSEEEQYRVLSQQLEKQASLGEITAIFAHEVRNPINNISTGLQLMAVNLPENDGNQEVIARLQQDCDRLAELMKSVLAFSKPADYKLEPFDLGESLKHLLERWRPRLVRANIKYFLQVESDTPQVVGDLRALEQVWNNLLNNAMQAMEQQGGSLTVKVRRVVTPDDMQRVEVSISDTGPGIPDEIRDRIFEPFFTTNRNGTGLGLSVTKHIITAHKGTIKVTSIPGGTAFQVLLPVAD